MESKAIVRYVGITPRKVRLVSDLVRGKSITQALTILKFSTRKRTAKTISTLLESAMANAEQKGRIDVDNLFVKTLLVDQGPTLKRFTSRAKGQGMRILKKTSHISVVLEEK
ncbi:MAG: 50S ribosomal protein L22 [Proteobacteria bacterium]|jgi:large subunit ribosomal protein L22|nr:MAG: 50S ribosomal protein L22 [Pseudomonadota bacterium]